MTHYLVTGGTGFLSTHLIAQLLTQGAFVRTTVRSLEKSDQVRQTMVDNHIPHLDRLSFAVADLNTDAGWAAAMADIEGVFSVASPVFMDHPQDAAAAMRPAIDGVQRVIKAAQAAGVRRLVMTANFGAVGFSNLDPQHVTTEADWTDPDQPGLSLYEKSKLLAEKAAWQLIDAPDNHLEFATINPVAILGPALSAHLSGSFSILTNLMNGSLKVVPPIALNIVDVRDVVKLHILAMQTPAANHQRFIAAADGMISMPQMAAVIRQYVPTVADKLPRHTLPVWALHLAAHFNRTAKEGDLLLRVNHHVSNQKARTVLGWEPLGSIQDTLQTTLASMAHYGVL